MNAPQVMTLQEAAEAGLLNPVSMRALELTARADALWRRPGTYMGTPEAVGLLSGMQATIESLLHELYGANRQLQGLYGLLGVEVAE